MSNMSKEWWHAYRRQTGLVCPEMSTSDKQGYTPVYTPQKRVVRAKKPKVRHVFSGEVFRMSSFSGDPALNRRRL